MSLNEPKKIIPMITLSKNRFYGSLAVGAALGAVVGVLLFPPILAGLTGTGLISFRSVSFYVHPKGSQGEGHVIETSVDVNGIPIPSWDDLMKTDSTVDWKKVKDNRIHVFGFPYVKVQAPGKAVDPYRCYYYSGGYAWYDDYPNSPPPPPPPCP